MSRLDSVRKSGIDWVKDLGRKNVEDLLTIIQWNEDNVKRLESSLLNCPTDARFRTYDFLDFLRKCSLTLLMELMDILLNTVLQS